MSRGRQSFSLPRPTWITLAAGALVVLYLATRLWFIHGFPYFSDEGLYATFADEGAHSLRELSRVLILGREPLDVWLAIPWIKLGFAPLTAVRLVSITAGLLTIAVTALIGRRLGGRGVALVAAGLAVVIPMFVVHDGIAIYEPLVTLIMATALYIQIELARHPRVMLGGFLGIVFGAGILTKQNTEPAIVLLPLSLLCFDWSSDGPKERLLRWLGAVGIAAVVLVGAELLLRSLHYYASYQAAQRDGVVPVRTLRQVLHDPFGSSTGHAWSVFRPALLGYVTAPLLIVTAAGAIFALRRAPRMTTALLGWIVVPFVVALLFTTLPFPRHVMYVLPPAIVLMSYGIVRAASWIAGVMPRRLAIGVCAGLTSLLLWPSLLFDVRVLARPGTARYPGLDEWQYVTGYPAGTVWPAVAATIRQFSGGRRVVVLTPLGSPFIVSMLLHSPRRYHFVWSTDPAASSAQLVVREGTPAFPDPKADAILNGGHFALVRQFARPNGGTVVRLYRRV